MHLTMLTVRFDPRDLDRQPIAPYEAACVAIGTPSVVSRSTGYPAVEVDKRFRG